MLLGFTKSGQPGGAGLPAADIAEYEFSTINLVFHSRKTQAEFADTLLDRRHFLIILWLGVSIAVTVASFYVDTHTQMMRWTPRVIHLTILVIPTFGIRRNAWITSHITQFLCVHYVGIMLKLCFYVGILEHIMNPADISPAYVYIIFTALLCMMTSWSFVLHIPFSIVAVAQLVLWIANYRVVLLLQSVPGVARCDPQVVLWTCVTVGAVKALSIYWMMRNTLMLFVERKLTGMRERQHYEREIENRRRYVAQTLHDIGTPLTTMSFGNHIFRTCPELPPELLDIAETQLVAIEMMTLTRRKAIDYAKLTQEGRLRPQLGMVDVRDLVLNKTRRIMTGYNSSQNVTLTCSVADDIAHHIITDRDWVWEMVVNLASNARKFTHQGTIHTRVTLIPSGTIGPPTEQDELMQATHNINLAPVAKSEQDMLVEVADTGMGVPADQAHRLFQPFSQLQIGAGGTGLGLYGVRIKAAILGGWAGYRPNTDAGRGSVFYFTVPYVRGDPNNMLLDSSASGGDGGTQGEHEALLSGSSRHLVPLSPPSGIMAHPEHRCGRVTPVSRQVTDLDQYVGAEPAKLAVPALTNGPMPAQWTSQPASNSNSNSNSKESAEDEDTRHRILLVEDDRMSQRLIARMLGCMDCIVEMASDGFEALNKLKASRYSLVVLDLGIPVLNGTEVTLRYRQWERQQQPPPPRLPIVVLSGAVEEAERQEVMRAGADQFLCKPVTPACFQECIGQILPKRSDAACCSPKTEARLAQTAAMQAQLIQKEQARVMMRQPWDGAIDRSLGGSTTAGTAAEPSERALASPTPSRAAPCVTGQATSESETSTVRPKVLLVEDEHTIAKLMRRLLENNGYAVEWACNGLEGLECMTSSKDYLAVLSDINMPSMDGYSMVERYRQWEREQQSATPTGMSPKAETRPDCKCKWCTVKAPCEDTIELTRCQMLSDNKQQYIAALSACSSEEDMGLAKMAGFSLFLTKPIQASLVVNILQQRQLAIAS